MSLTASAIKIGKVPFFFGLWPDPPLVWDPHSTTPLDWVQYLLFYAEIIDKSHKNHAYANLGHISAAMIQLSCCHGDTNITSLQVVLAYLPHIH